MYTTNSNLIPVTDKKLIETLQNNNWESNDLFADWDTGMRQCWSCESTVLNGKTYFRDFDIDKVHAWEQQKITGMSCDYPGKNEKQRNMIISTTRC